jgi:hypothetical protein
MGYHQSLGAFDDARRQITDFCDRATFVARRYKGL